MWEHMMLDDEARLEALSGEPLWSAEEDEWPENPLWSSVWNDKAMKMMDEAYERGEVGNWNPTLEG